MQRDDLRAYLLPLALEEERRMKKTKERSSWFLGLGILYVVVFHVVNFFFLLRNGIMMPEWLTILTALPGCCLLVVAGFGFVIASKNSVMELTPTEKQLL